MQPINALEYYHTSVTLRARSVRRIRAVRKLLSRAGIEFSESRIMDELLRQYLLLWRGQGCKPATLRRYNIDGQAYQIRPFYINRVLYAAATERATHSGESVSRMLDFAIRNYARRLIENFLRSARGVPEQKRILWATRYVCRSHREEFFISYKCGTIENKRSNLIWYQQTLAIPKKGLPAGQILAYLRSSA